MLTVALLSLTIVLGAVSFLIVSRSRSSEKSQYESLEANGALKRFDIIKQESGCLYAKQAQLWGWSVVGFVVLLANFLTVQNGIRPRVSKTMLLLQFLHL